MEEEELFDKVCKGRFDAIEANQHQILRLLRGKNSEPGLVDDVRALKKVYKAIIGVVVFIVALISTQFAIWLRGKLNG